MTGNVLQGSAMKAGLVDRVLELEVVAPTRRRLVKAKNRACSKLHTDGAEEATPSNGPELRFAT